MEVTIYEFMIHNNTIIKLEHSAIQKGNSYIFRFGRNNNQIKLEASQLDKINRNRVFTLVDNMSLYAELLLQDLEKKIEKDKKALDIHTKQYANIKKQLSAIKERQ